MEEGPHSSSPLLAGLVGGGKRRMVFPLPLQMLRGGEKLHQ